MVFPFEMLNVDVKDVNINQDGYILFCGQKPIDVNVQTLNYNEYVNEADVE